MSYNGTKYSYIRNLQGDVIAILNSNGATMVEYDYDAWGNILSITGALASTLGAFNPFRYRGYYYDTETGFYYLQSRYYDPQVGRFINADEPVLLGANGGIMGYNMFAYCDNNPVMYVDLYGLCKHQANGYCQQCYREAMLAGIDIEEKAQPQTEPPKEHGTYSDTGENFYEFIGNCATFVDLADACLEDFEACLILQRSSLLNVTPEIDFCCAFEAFPGIYENYRLGSGWRSYVFDATIDIGFAVGVSYLSAVAGATLATMIFPTSGPVFAASFIISFAVEIALNCAIDYSGIKPELKSLM